MNRLSKLVPIALVAGLAACQNHVPVGMATDVTLSGADSAHCVAQGTGHPVEFMIPALATLPPADEVTGQVTIACFAKGFVVETRQVGMFYGAPRDLAIAMDAEPDAALQAVADNQFTLYFDGSMARWQGNKRSAATLDDAVARFLTAGPAEIVIASHADGQGLYAANDRLAEKRGREVADELIARGVPGNLIRIDGFSEHFPAKALAKGADTAAAVAANRRAVIRIKSLKADRQARYQPEFPRLNDRLRGFAHRFSQCQAGC